MGIIGNPAPNFSAPAAKDGVAAGFASRGFYLE